MNNSTFYFFIFIFICCAIVGSVFYKSNEEKYPILRYYDNSYGYYMTKGDKQTAQYYKDLYLKFLDSLECDKIKQDSINPKSTFLP